MGYSVSFGRLPGQRSPMRKPKMPRYFFWSPFLFFCYCLFILTHSRRRLFWQSSGTRQVCWFLWQIPHSTSSVPVFSEVYQDICFVSQRNRLRLWQWPLEKSFTWLNYVFQPVCFYLAWHVFIIKSHLVFTRLLLCNSTYDVISMRSRTEGTAAKSFP